MELSRGWELAGTPPSACRDPSELEALGVQWRPASVPGTVAAAVDHRDRDLDAEDWWFRCRFELAQHGEGEPVLELDGLATECEVFLNGTPILHSSSMWRQHAVGIGAVASTAADNELVIVCRALAPLLERRRRPRARWRTRVVNRGNLRWHRTMLLGRSPGFAPGPAAVGPWRPIRVVRRRADDPLAVRITADLEGETGRVRALVTMPRGVRGELALRVGERCAHGGPDELGQVELCLELGEVARWWPHTHGEPALHEVCVKSGDRTLARRRVGFRSLRFPRDIPEDGFSLQVNGVPVFLRGAVWTPLDLVALAPAPGELRRTLERVRACGMNLVRVVGTGHYESPEFHDLCDELGILVWQDLMFANLDYPLDDEDFRREVENEAREVLTALSHRPSLVCVCGNSEVEQQPAMMGLDPQLGRHPFWERTLPRIVAELRPDVACVRSTPCGGDLPFHPDRGVTHYFGVSGYLLDVEDARRSAVRFATECLAFANVPDEVTVPVHHPLWKAGVQRDAGSGWDIGAGWDFDDVRDHYLERRYGVGAVQLRRVDHARYLDLSRMVTGEVMAEVMGEWRREGSTCRGALVLWLTDMAPGAGLGILDSERRPKACYHHLRRALAPVAVWMTGETTAGVAIHLANDGPDPVLTTLRVALYRRGEAEVAGAEETLTLAPHATARRTVEGMIGSFLDAAWAYRFGPPAAEAIVASLLGDDRTRPISSAVHFPAGPPTERLPAASLGVSGRARHAASGDVIVSLSSRALLYGARVRLAGYEPEDDLFCVEPGHARHLTLSRPPQARASGPVSVTALNLAAPISVSIGEDET
jgi:beta-mannosidase